MTMSLFNLPPVWMAPMAGEAASAALVAAVSAHCSDERFQSLEDVLMAYYPALEDEEGESRRRARRGYAQFGLLDATPPGRRSAALKARLRTLRRRFSLPSPPPARGIISGFVGSPHWSQVKARSEDVKAVGAGA